MQESNYLIIHQLSIISFIIICFILFRVFEADDEKSLLDDISSFVFTGVILLPIFALTPTVFFDLVGTKNYELKYSLTYLYTGIFHFIIIKKIISAQRENKTIRDKTKNSKKGTNKPIDNTNKNDIINIKSNKKEYKDNIHHSDIKNETLTNNSPISVNKIKNQEIEILSESTKKNKLRDAINEIANKELRENEIDQIINYIIIFKENKCDQHWEVNEIISKTGKWNEFNEIRSLNTHDNGFKVKGITPFHFYLNCKVLAISADDGSPLVKSEKY